MASAALNTTAGMLEALVSRGPPSTSPQGTRDAMAITLHHHHHQQPGSPSSPPPPPPTPQHSTTDHQPNPTTTTTTPAHHAYLHAHFQGVSPHFMSGGNGSGDLHDMSTSGGDATTEDDETSLNDQLAHYYNKSPGDDQVSASGKNNRRKQSKPVRLPTPHGEASEPGETAQNQLQNKPEESQFDSEISNPSPGGEEGYTCTHCHMQAPSDDSLRRHIIEEHIGRLLRDDEAHQQQQLRQELRQEQETEPGERVKEDEEARPLNLSSPRWEGQPPLRPQDGSGRSPPTSIPMPPSFGDMKINLPGLLPLGPPPFLLPFLQNTDHERLPGEIRPQHNSSSPNGQQNRIFNQEAYCNLCHKEFCNKYFLKTHKANKHGIYSPEISSSPTGMTSGHSTPLGPSVPLAAPLGPSLSSGGLVGSPYAGAFIAASMNSLPLRPLLSTHLNINKPMPMVKPETSNSSSSNNSNNTKAGGVINLEAYCELCQKEFCNKYFLKRHKSKIHGITIDVVTKPKTPGQMPPRMAPDRPEGWCDACRRDIGGRASLNAHKFQVHGPHIVVPLPSPHSTSPQAGRNPRTPTPKDSRKDNLDHKDSRNYFSPWETFKDSREQGREVWDSRKDSGEIKREPRDHARANTPVRSPWDRPLGSPWNTGGDLHRSDGSRESPKEATQRNNSWSENDQRNNDQYNQHGEQSGSIPHLEYLPEALDFPLNGRDMQAMREQQQREWALQQRDFEQHHERMQQQYREREKERERELREREIQERELREQELKRERDAWACERERQQEMYREQQLEREHYEREQRQRILLEQERELQHQQKIRDSELEIKREPNYLENEGSQCDGQQQSEGESAQKEIRGHDDNKHIQKEICEQQRVDERESTSDIPKSSSEGKEIESEHREIDSKINEGGSESHKKECVGQEGGSECQEVRSEGHDGSIGGNENNLENRDLSHDGQEICRELNREGHRTPGGSSADESSRDTGIIARVGQPAMVQAPPGTKFTPEQLRHLGVINPDAFCELCCKEFCNKYFLRTHRIKKHGIYTPEFSDRSKTVQKDNPQLNLARLLERQTLDVCHTLDVRPTVPDIDSELECDLCHRPFPSPYLLQMHKYYFHGPGQETAQQEQFSIRPHPSPHEQLRQLAIHAQQQAHQQAKQHQQHQKRIQEQQRRLQEHQQRLQLKQEEEQREQTRLEHERQQPETNSDEGEVERNEEIPRPSVIESAGSGESDISEDLRKLQSMILQLNRQGEIGLRCRICNKDLGNKYFLRAHMMTEHGILGHEDVSAPPSEGAQTPKTPREPTPKVSPPSTPTSGENQAFCNVCKKDFFSRYILQQHMLSAHGVFTPPAPPTSFMERIRAEVESREERKPNSTSRSYCEICNKELCNKYFMKTHMLKMHGINMENGITGGVTCDLCNKELCSKYFLRVHKQNTHGLIEEGREVDEGIDKSEIEPCPLCPRRFKNRKWLKTHLTSDHDEAGKKKWHEIEATLPAVPEASQQHGPSCVLCGHVLPDLVALQLHVIKMHGPQDGSMDIDPVTPPDEAKTRPFQCSTCPFTAPSPAILYAHARTHAPGMPPFPGVLGQTIPCPLCSQVLPGLEAYQHHLLQHQLQGLLKPLLEKDPPPELNARESFETPQEKDETLPQAPPSKPKKRWRCSQCSRRFRSRALCLAHVHACHNPRARGTWLGRPPIQRRLFKCRKCGAVAPRLTMLRQHIREQHRAGPGVPTTHATPTKPQTAGRFVMQPFLLNNEDSDRGEDNEKEQQSLNNRQFVPSLVYLPVARRVHRPLIVSFSLTPA